ncbi:hypothetical protein LQU94_00525 [Peptoniphilus sp. KCTC 25270]|uniref:restriction endonuclease n=1 Tax=Peptoniphilus sp. KCTC 25270 TaxID=2897414 RepID=UPI001E2CF177|nr:hypothetical protein [Peptoniphilus sp. KCTC 25270]MCD1146600.1 hypothetical protein [Peptoniphilus sp. KCTC 25270]
MKKDQLPSFYRQGFEYDCPHGSRKEYSLFHRPRPLNLNEAMETALEYLLWYVPNINSLQSSKNELIEKALYDEFTFSLILEEMELTEKDAIFLKFIDDDIVEYYREAICTRCQKIILTQADGETKTSSLLRHLRNAIAHGLFNVVDDMLVAFDMRNYNRENGTYICSGIMKLYPTHLLKALSLLESELTHEKLAELAFERNGYEIIDNDRDNPSLPFDFRMKKERRTYAVEIKKFEIEGIISPMEVKDILGHFPGDTDDRKILIVDSAKLDENAKKQLNDEKILLFDQRNIEALLMGEDKIPKIEKAKKK